LTNHVFQAQTATCGFLATNLATLLRDEERKRQYVVVRDPVPNG
jgi:hypothetical protein